MSDVIFHVFSDERFLDLTVYQYGYEKCAPLHSFGPNIRNHYLFHYVISGKGHLSVTRGTHSDEYDIGENSGFLIEPGHINLYSASHSEPWEYMWVEFDGLRAKELVEESGLSSRNPVFLPTAPPAGLLLKEEMQKLLQMDGNDQPLRIIAQLYSILDALIQGSSSRKRTQGGKLSRFYAQEALSFIAQNYSSPVTVEEIAKQCNLDRSYFGKIFKDAIGQTPQDFLIRYRMSKAATLLVSTALPIGDISVQVGYPNQLHFSRAFKSVYGVAPRTYRQENRLIT